jgi:energy-converting hydrogenase A subunit M
MATVYEIIQGINQAAANAAWDGAHEESLQADGKARSAGLKREDGHYINDRRVMDGFQVKFYGPVLRLTYQAETRIKEVQDNGFENDVVGRLAEVIKFLKKEYKAITGNALTLTLEGEHHILVQRISNYRTDVQAHCDYRIGGLTDVVEVNEGSDEDRLDDAIKKWLALGPKNKRPQNDTRKGK